METFTWKKDAHSNTHAHPHIQTHCNLFYSAFLLTLTPRQTVRESISNFSEARSLEGFSTKTGRHPSFPLSFPLRSLPQGTLWPASVLCQEFVDIYWDSKHLSVFLIIHVKMQDVMLKPEIKPISPVPRIRITFRMK